MPSRTRSLAGGLAAGLAALLSAAPAAAQDSTARTDSLHRAPGRDSVAHRLGAVVVTGAARRAGYAPARITTATKTETPLHDTPQAVSVVTRALITDQAMQGMADVLRYVPGVTMGQGEGHRDAPTIRGNASTADFFVDGVRDDAQYLRDLYNVERVEALRGSNAMVFGRGGGGGVINRVTKQAQWTPTRELALEGGSWGHRRLSLDLGQGLGDALAGRVNGVYERSESFRDGLWIERRGVNPTAALLAGAGTVVRVGYEYFDDERTVDRGIPSYQGRPSPAGISTFFGDPDVNRSRTTVHTAAATIEHDAGRGVRLRNATRYAWYDKYYQNVYPGAVTADGAQVALSAYGNAHRRGNLFNQTDLVVDASTGALRHTLLVGSELGRQQTANLHRTGYFGGDSTQRSVLVPFEDPRLDVPVGFTTLATDADNHVTADVAALYAQDQVALSARWQAIVGVRWDRFALRFDDHRTGATLGRTDRVVSPRAGLLFQPVKALSLYGQYGVSFLPSAGDQFSSLSASTETLEPERFTNHEVGAKWDVRPELALTAALYRLDRTNTKAPDPADPTRLVQTGAQRSTGFELELSGRVTSAWQLAGGWAVQRAAVTSRTSAAAAGASVPLVPHHTLSLWNRWQIAPAWALGLGATHRADMYAAVDNTVTLPGYTRVDGALYFTPFSRRLRAQLNVENLLGARFYETSHGNNNILPGAPRTVRVTLATEL